MFWAIASSIVGIMMAIAMVFIRIRASKKPANVKKILLPPLFMSTGAFMFLFPVFQVSWKELIEAIVVGSVFSLLLIRTTKFEIRRNEIYLIPSKLFLLVLLGLLIIRIIAKLIVGQTISVGETSGLFFLLAFAMIVNWRISMLIKYLSLQKQINRNQNAAIKKTF